MGLYKILKVGPTGSSLIQLLASDEYNYDYGNIWDDTIPRLQPTMVNMRNMLPSER